MRWLVAFFILCASPAFSQGWENGQLQGRDFVWSNGGGDPYTGTLSQALQLAGVGDARVQNLLVAAVNAAPQGNAPRHTIQNGDRLGVMISGDGWVAQRPVAQVSTWQQGRSRQARVWYILDPETGVQYRLMRAEVCGNWLIEYFGAAERCQCRPGKDACATS